MAQGEEPGTGALVRVCASAHPGLLGLCSR